MASTVEAAEMRPDRAVQEITKLVGCGTAVELIEADSQCYAFVKGIIAPSPPWSKKLFDILIAIPAVFDAAELDGFYVELPCLHSNCAHPRVQGQIIDVGDRKWQLVSWHYPDGKPWVRGQDSIETHIVHCRGFFLDRGATNER
jgi:hypothetical protein